MAFEEIRGFDWIMLVVEILVLVAILVFEGPKWWHERESRKKAKLLIPLLELGENLRNSVPFYSNLGHNALYQQLTQWRERALKWDLETQEFIAELSPRALSTYKHIVHLRETDRAVLTPDGVLYPVQGPFGDAYQLLQARLDNLQKIIDNADVYF
ncbi:MAG: hypothetical protein ABSC77_11880 [Terracidiphilus sp.]|jgi:hypothetical protein